jgi:hypothetical protein
LKAKSKGAKEQKRKTQEKEEEEENDNWYFVSKVLASKNNFWQNWKKIAMKKI